jgi:hypothetical protein
MSCTQYVVGFSDLSGVILTGRPLPSVLFGYDLPIFRGMGQNTDPG